LLRDGFALAASGGKESVARLAGGALRAVVATTRLAKPPDDAVDPVLSGFAHLAAHPDVPDGLRLLRQHGLRLVTLTNGSAGVADRLLTNAGIRGEFEQLLSVDDADAWKPAPTAYAYAARACSAGIEHMLLVAVHPWDIHGAHQAGMRTGWIRRQDTPYPDYFPPRTCERPTWARWPGRSSPDPSCPPDFCRLPWRRKCRSYACATSSARNSPASVPPERLTATRLTWA